MNALLSDHQIGVMMVINSGQPDAIDSTRDLNFDGFNNDRPLFISRNGLTAPVRSNVDIRYSRFFRVWGDRRLELQIESKNIFNTEQVVGVFNRITVDADGFPLDAAGNRLDPSTISTDQDDYIANSWREQRKLQIGLTVLF